ncbi:hypothetical protein OG914_25115 [Streptomyces sp. NBC_00291]|uniref:hypothetical protein n=1 Tax=Streptomyces sp. NBC_00291 TaxID=2975704 RepID=UPI002252E13E|nr:hypothetical protein [Streptomyces sp. NBC_00291]MCX5157269.1 hypothetical protein [Streptomyces sp. NBC_00291]
MTSRGTGSGARRGSRSLGVDVDVGVDVGVGVDVDVGTMGSERGDLPGSRPTPV